MTIYAVTRHEVHHTCPADPTPHMISSTQRVIDVVPGRDCLTPVTIRCGDVTTTVPCGQNNPHHRQCSNCRTVVRVMSVTITEESA